MLDDAAGAPGYCGRITRVRSDGSASWTIGPPGRGADDAWTAVRIDRDQVVANSWSGYLVTFDATSGAELVSVLTK